MTTTAPTLVTGAGGCIGAWIVRQLSQAGEPVVAFDLRPDARRLGLLLEPDALAAVTWASGDVTDLDTVERVLDEHAIGAVIHLAALQAPFCRADPPRGAHVNVVGTVNLLEALARRADRVTGPFVYASSVAAADRDEGAFPETIYGVYKRACEGAADVYLRERGQSSIGLRPHTVYGPGRDQGITSATTVAMLAAAAGAPYEIPFTGRLTMQYARDVAAAFVSASRAAHDGADVYDLPGETVDVSTLVAAIAAAAPGAAISAAGAPLPFPADVSPRADAPFSAPCTPLAEGVADAVGRLRALHAAGLVDPPA